MYKRSGAICYRGRRVIALMLAAWLPLSLDAAEPAFQQEMLATQVRIVDPEGQPVAGATVIPWAIRRRQGHGLWTPEGQGGSEPPRLTTDADGRVVVPYPRYARVSEGIIATEITISIDHPAFAFINHEFIDVPAKTADPHVAKLARGAALELVPLENGRPAALDALHVIWSDGRSWTSGDKPQVAPGGVLKIPPMRQGKGRALVVRLAEDRATHFSSIVEVDLEVGKTVRREVELRPAIALHGALSENVPRPVTQGRIKAQSLSPTADVDSDIEWCTWAPIAEDGTFTIDAWPADVPIQLVALCNGFIAESGAPPAVAQNVHDPDGYYRPQVYLPEAFGADLTVPMTPLVSCQIEAVDDQGQPLADAKVSSYPNVGWYNGGSQVYCDSLVRGEKLLANRDYVASVEEAYSDPFSVVTDERGRATLPLPAGEQDIVAQHELYELPVIRGRRRLVVDLTPGQAADVKLVMQPKGNEFLGEWDKLSGVLFGCTGDECRRLLDDPIFRQRITVVGELLDTQKNPVDPGLLTTAYADMAEAFDHLGEKEEAAKWRRKSKEQAAKLATGKLDAAKNK